MEAQLHAVPCVSISSSRPEVRLSLTNFASSALGVMVSFASALALCWGYFDLDADCERLSEVGVLSMTLNGLEKA